MNFWYLDLFIYFVFHKLEQEIFQIFVKIIELLKFIKSL